MENQRGRAHQRQLINHKESDMTKSGNTVAAVCPSSGDFVAREPKVFLEVRDLSEKWTRYTFSEHEEIDLLDFAGLTDCVTPLDVYAPAVCPMTGEAVTEVPVLRIKAKGGGVEFTFYFSSDAETAIAEEFNVSIRQGYRYPWRGTYGSVEPCGVTLTIPAGMSMSVPQFLYPQPPHT